LVHRHFFVEDKQELIDVLSSDHRVNELPNPPKGHEVARVDVVLWLRRKQPR
jgi:Fur family iron response transcriptional regulator